MVLLIRWLVNTLALLIVAELLSGMEFASFYSAFITALILGLVNMVVRPVLILLTLPINLLTLGLFTFVINALMILLVSTIVRGFTIDTFTTALLAAIILWLISFMSNAFQELFQPRHSHHSRG